ncbi:hypothetical protein ACIGB8_28705 [Promicromonospora sukumoe]|uniref:hypothetical protein n=1 Tax=Promicromonospora sukumoe TaxID=88382 RepID=UPI0037CAAF3B
MKVRTTRLIRLISTPLLWITSAAFVIGALVDSLPLTITGSAGLLGTLGLAMAATHYRGVNARAGLHEPE